MLGISRNFARYEEANLLSGTYVKTTILTLLVVCLGILAEGCSSEFNAAKRSPATKTPEGPQLVSVNPAALANNNTPYLIGTADEKTSVEIYLGSDCTGFLAAVGTAEEFAVPGIQVSVADDTTTTYSVRGVNGSNRSACSSSITYVEDSTPPVAPSPIAVTPTGPANNNSPQISGLAETGSTVNIYATNNCGGAIVATDSAVAFTTGITVAVGDDTTTSFTAKAVDLAGNVSACSATVSYTEDSTPPAVTGVTSSTANGSYGPGSSISIQVNFSETVVVTGTPQLTVETGATDAVVNYASGSGTSTLTFTYTVGAGQNSLDLDYVATTSLALNGGTIRDLAANDATLALAAPSAANSLGANKAIVIDTISPTVTNVTSSKADGTYPIGTVIAVQVTFSEIVNVTGTPQLTLETGGTDAVVDYSSGSGTNTLTFNYTVAAGQNSLDLDYVATTSLAFNSGTIKDTVTTNPNNAVLTLFSPGAAGSLGANKALVIDTTVPTVTNVSSSTANDTYGMGAAISIQVSFSEAVTVTGIPQLTLETGATDAVVNYASGSGSSTLAFTYTVGAGHSSGDLDYAATTSLALNGGAIKDASTNDATLTLPSPGAAGSLGVNKAIVIDAVAPTVTNVTSSTADGVYTTGAVIAVQVTLSKAVNVTGTPQLTLETGATDAVVDYSSGTGTNTLTFSYTVASGHTTGDLDYVATTSLALNSGTIKDTVANNPNNATLTLSSPGAAGSLGANKAIVIDTSVPTITSVNSSTADGTYGTGSTISIQVNFSEAVTVTGTPQLTLETGATDAVVDYASGSGTSTLTFTYTVDNGHGSLDLDYVATTSLALNGGTIKDTATNNATLTLASPGAAGSLGANKAIVIDGVAPTVTNVTSSSADGSYTVGAVIPVQVTFSKVVNVTGTPQLTLETGATDAVVDYSSGTGTNTLTFNYTVALGHTSLDLDYVTGPPFALNGGTIKDTVANSPNDATLVFVIPGSAGSLGANKAIVIDTTAPTLTVNQAA
ncbi:MAG: hypothetical protein HYW49_11565, partial [Deltaproteobacteria bacterium]|nr:hypothetical protein [Deltaproteobacteria bacterium]